MSVLTEIINAINCNICSVETKHPCPRSDCAGKYKATEHIRLLFEYVESTAADLKEHAEDVDCGGPYGTGGKGVCSMCSAALILERALRGER